MTDNPEALRARIHEKAGELMARQIQPTLARIMGELGGGGDPAVILPMLQEWRVVRALTENRNDHARSWEALTESLQAITGDFRSIEQVLKRQALDEARAVSDEESGKWRAAYETRIAALTEERDRLAGQLQEKPAERSGGPEIEIVGQAQKAPPQAPPPGVPPQSVSPDREADKKKIAALEQRGVLLERELVAARNQIAELRRSLEGEREEKRKSVDVRKQAEQQVRTQAEQQLASLRLLVAQRDSTISAMNDNLESLRKRLADADGGLADADRQISALKERLAAPRTAAEVSFDTWLTELPLEPDQDIPAELPRRLAMASIRIAALRSERNALLLHLNDTRNALSRTYGLVEQTVGTTWRNEEGSDVVREQAELARRSDEGGGTPEADATPDIVRRLPQPVPEGKTPA